MKTYYRPFSGRVDVIACNPSAEVIAFAMSRFSRSCDDLETSLKKVQGYADDRHAKFFEENYHSYGHASIGDQAHIAFAVQDVSMLAIFYLWQMLELVDGQERSSRYQPFDITGYSLFGCTEDTPNLNSLIEVGDLAFATYSLTQKAVVESYRKLHPDSQLFKEGGGMSREKLAKQLARDSSSISDEELARANSIQADRIRNARAFDVARYLLPLGTNTSAGYIMSARSAERIISLLHVHPWAEMQWLGQAIQESLTPHLPNLLKYTKPNSSETERQKALKQIANEVIPESIRVQETGDFGVRIHYPTPQAMLNIAARLLFPHTTASWETIISCLEDNGPTVWKRILDEGGWNRESKEDFPRDSRGSELTVELVMDIGAARDYNRHRGCFKQYQLPSLGVLRNTLEPIWTEMPKDLRNQKIKPTLEAMQATSFLNHNPYLLPLASQIHAIYHMSWQQLIYMTELRSIPGGHPAYRKLTAKLLEAVSEVDLQMYEYLQTKLDSGAFRFTPYEATEGKFFVR